MQTVPLTIIGNYLSPYVRKVLAVCALKGLAVEVDPIVPFFGDDRFAELSPLRRIPVLVDGDVVLADSTVICEYLDELYPARPVLPKSPADRARARWLEEYADTRIGDVLIWKIFFRAAVAPAIFGAPRDLEAIGRAMSDDLPDMMNYLEREAPRSGFLFGELGLADLAVAVHFANLRWSRQILDKAAWPRASAWVERVERAEPLAGITALAEQCLRLAPSQHRAALQSAGVKLARDSRAAAKPRRGPMTFVG